MDIKLKFDIDQTVYILQYGRICEGTIYAANTFSRSSGVHTSWKIKLPETDQEEPQIVEDVPEDKIFSSINALVKSLRANMRKANTE